MNNRFKILSIIVTHNAMQNNWLYQCLDSLINSTLHSEIMMIDNNSADNTVYEIEKHYPSVNLIQLNENIGFAKANNIGFKKALEANYDYTYFTISNQFFSKNIFFSEPINKVGEPTCVMFTKSIFEKTGIFNNSLPQRLAYEYWFRILNDYEIVRLIINKPLAKFRIHDKQASAENERKNIDDYAAYDKFIYLNIFRHLSFSKKINYIYQYVIKARLKKLLYQCL